MFIACALETELPRLQQPTIQVHLPTEVAAQGSAVQRQVAWTTEHTAAATAASLRVADEARTVERAEAFLADEAAAAADACAAHDLSQQPCSFSAA